MANEREALRAPQAVGTGRPLGTSSLPVSALHQHRITSRQARPGAMLSSDGQPHLPVLTPSCGPRALGPGPGHMTGLDQWDTRNCAARGGCRSVCTPRLKHQKPGWPARGSTWRTRHSPANTRQRWSRARCEVTSEYWPHQEPRIAPTRAQQNGLAESSPNCRTVSRQMTGVISGRVWGQFVMQQ